MTYRDLEILHDNTYNKYFKEHGEPPTFLRLYLSYDVLYDILRSSLYHPEIKHLQPHMKTGKSTFRGIPVYTVREEGCCDFIIK